MGFHTAYGDTDRTLQRGAYIVERLQENNYLDYNLALTPIGTIRSSRDQLTARHYI